MWTRSSIISHAIEHTFTAISADGCLALGRSGIIAAHINHLMIEVPRSTSTKCLEDYLTPQTPTATKDHIESSTQLHRLLGHRDVAAKLCLGFGVLDREQAGLLPLQLQRHHVYLRVCHISRPSTLKGPTPIQQIRPSICTLHLPAGDMT
jgi:hypothetical protein